MPDHDTHTDDGSSSSSSAARGSRRRVSTAREDLLTAALAAGATHRDAGRAAGLSERTVRRRLEDDAFCERVAEAEVAYVEQVTKRLTGLAPSAVETMAALMCAPETPAAVRLRASSYLLTASRVWREANELEARIRYLEAQQVESSQEWPR